MSLLSNAFARMIERSVALDGEGATWTPAAGGAATPVMVQFEQAGPAEFDVSGLPLRSARLAVAIRRVEAPSLALDDRINFAAGVHAGAWIVAEIPFGSHEADPLGLMWHLFLEPF